MFLIVKSGYETKDKMLALFQFGYLGLLSIGFLARVVGTLEFYLHDHNPARWMILRYATDIFNFSVLIPYAIYTFKRAEKKKKLAVDK
jgi:uncharacterized membrane protein